MTRHKVLYFKDRDWLVSVEEKARHGEVWLVVGDRKRIPVLVEAVAVFDSPDDLGAWGFCCLDCGPRGRWPMERVPEWARAQMREGGR
jgi:hypothetical protein